MEMRPQFFWNADLRARPRVARGPLLHCRERERERDEFIYWEGALHCSRAVANWGSFWLGFCLGVTKRGMELRTGEIVTQGAEALKARPLVLI